MSVNCFHCGDDIIGKGLLFDQHQFCCNGCMMVYQLLSENDMETYYTLENKPGIKPQKSNEGKYNFLEVESIQEKIIEFREENLAKVTLFLPEIHCSSCIYLLENLSKINSNIINCQVNFTKREASISFNIEKFKLSELADLLDKIGYAPNFGDRSKSEKQLDKQFLYKLGIAGFAFGSIMLWSFPEYLGIEDMNAKMRNFTSYLSFIVSIPVLLYSANNYYISAYKALKYKSLNLDVPVTIGIIALYAQSSYSIFTGDGPGYMDSFATFIFWLLIGKWFQNKTYKTLSFERDYKSYFPVATTKIVNNTEEIVEIENVHVGDHIQIKNDEIIPCDCELLTDEAKIDYSFVTGESIPITKKKGEFIYAGGKLIGKRSDFKVLKETSRSHLTQLWNDVIKEDKDEKHISLQDKMSVYFLTILLIIAAISGISWAFIDSTKITQIVVSILIVACPCALAISAPFTYGNVTRVLGRKGLYIKNAKVIERMNEVTDIVFDKTGTLTTGILDGIEYKGRAISNEEIAFIIAVSHSSTHPLSKALVQHLKQKNKLELPSITLYEEIPGKGMYAEQGRENIKIGSYEFVDEGQKTEDEQETSVSISINGKYVGRFIFHSELREGIQNMVKNLDTYQLHIVSGDKAKDEDLLRTFFPKNTIYLFNQSPKDKLSYIENLLESEKKVMMIGDGLNDAGALGKANVGVAVSEDIFRFTPSSDAIIEASKLNSLPKLLSISKFSKTVLNTCLAFSLTYNVFGLSIAISGQMSPLVAAILMPISSITVVFISTFFVLWKGKSN